MKENYLRRVKFKKIFIGLDYENWGEKTPIHKTEKKPIYEELFEEMQGVVIGKKSHWAGIYNKAVEPHSTMWGFDEGSPAFLDRTETISLYVVSIRFGKTVLVNKNDIIFIS